MPVIRGVFPQPKPCPKPSMGSWSHFTVEESATIDLKAGEVRGFQGLCRQQNPDPTLPDKEWQDTSEAFKVALQPQDVAAIEAILDARIAALGVKPERTFTLSLAGTGVGADYGALQFQPVLTDIQQIMGLVLLRAKEQDTMGVYDDPAWGGQPIVMTVDGVPV